MDTTSFMAGMLVSEQSNRSGPPVNLEGASFGMVMFSLIATPLLSLLFLAAFVLTPSGSSARTPVTRAPSAHATSHHRALTWTPPLLPNTRAIK